MGKENLSSAEENTRIEKFGKYYNEKDLWKKIHSLPRSSVNKILERVLLLRELLFDAKTPYWVRGTLIGALGYVIFPFDLSPDFIPGVGFLDDLAIMGLVLGNLDHLVTDKMRERVSKRISDPLEGRQPEPEPEPTI